MGAGKDTHGTLGPKPEAVGGPTTTTPLAAEPFTQVHEHTNDRDPQNAQLSTVMDPARNADRQKHRPFLQNVNPKSTSGRCRPAYSCPQTWVKALSLEERAPKAWLEDGALCDTHFFSSTTCTQSSSKQKRKQCLIPIYHVVQMERVKLARFQRISSKAFHRLGSKRISFSVRILRICPISSRVSTEISCDFDGSDMDRVDAARNDLANANSVASCHTVNQP